MPGPAPGFGRRLQQLLLALVVTAGLAGCASVNRLQQALPPEVAAQPLELSDTPFYPQKLFQCGPAALATVLNHAGVQIRPDELTPQVYLPGRLGSLQLEMLAAARRNGRIPYPVRGDLNGIAAELRAGHPVLVLQNVGYRFAPVWHYAVVIGLDAREDEVILRSGTTERLRMNTDDFLDSWEAGGHWGLVTLKPGELPAQPDAARYLAAVADMEATGSHEAALAGYRTATARWPGLRSAQLGVANSLYALGRVEDAEAAYARLLARWPEDVVALNNLAMLQAARGCRTEALALIGRAESADTGAFRDALAESRATVERSEGDRTACP